MRRSLFEDLRPPPPQQAPRLKPNVFARATQWAVQNALMVMVSSFIYCALLAYPLIVAPPDFAPLEFSGQSQANSNWARLQRGFPGIENLATLALAHPDAEKLQSLRQDVVEKLKARSDLFQLVLAPGAGDYYSTYGVYYRKPAELDARVAYALSLKTLFEAIAAAPRGDSLATLVNEVAASIEQGRDPQGLDMLFTEASAAVNALLTGQERRVDWLKVAGLDLEDNAQAGIVLVWPRLGQAEAANLMLDGLAQTLRTDPQVSLSIQKSALGDRLGKGPTPDYSPLGLGALSCLLAVLLLQVLLGQIRLALAAIAPALAASLTAASLLAFGLHGSWLAFWPVIASAGAIGLVLGLRFVFAALEPLQQNRPVITSAMLAAQKQGPGLFWLALAGTLPWFAFFMLNDTRFLWGTGALAAAMLVALMATIYLQPVLLQMMGDRYEWQARDWLQPIHDGLFANPIWSVLRALLMAAVLPLVLLGLWLHPLLSQPNISQQLSRAPVNLLARSPEAGEEIIAKLKSVPEAGAIRWLGAFLPDDVEAKQLVLAKLADAFPKIQPQQPSDLDDLQQQMDTLRESLTNIAAAEHARPELKSAADDLRRSLELFANTGTDRELLSFENRFFGGFNRLATTAEALASLKPPEISDLDPDLKAMFQAKDGELRIEVTPARGATSLALAQVLDQRGMPVAHPLLGGFNNLELFWRNLNAWIVPSFALVVAGVILGLRRGRGIVAAMPVAAVGLAALTGDFLQLGFSARPETLLLGSSALTLLLLVLLNSFLKTPVTANPPEAARHAAEAWAPSLLVGALSAPVLILQIDPWSSSALLLLGAGATVTGVVGLLLAPFVKLLGPR